MQFRWFEAAANNAGSVAEHLQEQLPFLFASNFNAGPDEHHGWTLKKQYTEWIDEHVFDNTGEGVTGDDIIEYAISSAWSTIAKHSFYPWKFHPRNWDEPSPGSHATIVSHIDVRLLRRDLPNVTKPLAGEVDESYTLTLDEDGKATVTANSSIGIARGMTSFTQLFYKHSDGKHVYTPFAPVTIHDSPKFQHRGINLDVSRNWFPVSSIKRQIDAIAYNKMNRLHLHITDSQSWPLEIPALPDLAAKGAYRPDLVYSPDDFKHIQRYAALKGVEVITEVDMPGHTSSIAYAYPDLIAAFNKQPDWSTYCAEPPCGTLKLNSTAVYEFLETLFGDLLPRITPYSSYFHTGGDEVNKNSYLLHETVKSNNTEVLQALMQTFLDYVHGQVRAVGLTPMVWEEMLLEWDLNLGEDVVVQSWRSDEAVAKIVSKGHKALVGNYKAWVSPSRSLLTQISTGITPCSPSLTSLTKHAVSRLRQRPMARLRPLHIRQILPIQRLLRAISQLASRILRRPVFWRTRGQTAPRDRR